jgi:exodeoxyribonuclease VII large subunit
LGLNIIVTILLVVGLVSLKKAKPMLAKKLKDEGLFSAERKRSLPYPPDKVGLITSVESAAYADFVKIINQRWGNIRIELVDCLVQGTEAPAQLVGALEHFNQMAKPPEVLVMIRGGGSADDLAAFSTEQVVRAVAASRIPTLVAIGHEVDISLAELAADRQASTPSNAAELLVPDIDHEKVNLANLKKHMYRSVQALYTDKKQRTGETRDRMNEILNNIVARHSDELQQRGKLLKALDPQAPLRRGFALVRSPKGELIRSAKAAKQAGRLSIELHDGKISAKVVDKD